MSSLEIADGKPLTEDEIHHAAAEGLRVNRYYADDTLRESWRQAYAYYKGVRPPPGETDSDARGDESEAISTDVSDVIEWVLPTVVKNFVESPDVVRFDPVSPEDVEQADLESDYVHHTFMKKCDGFLKLYCHVKDALLLKNAIFMTYWEDRIETQAESYENLLEEEVADLMYPADGSEVRVLSASAREDPFPDPLTGLPMEPAPQIDPQTGQPAIDPVTGQPLPPELPPMRRLYDLRVRRFRRKGKPVVRNCVPELFWVKMNHDSVNLTDARYCSYTQVVSRAQLVADGYSREQIDNISTGTRRIWDNEVRWAREDVEHEQNSLDGDRNETPDPSQDLIDVHNVYLVLDADGDGVEEKYLAILGGTNGEVMLDFYEVPENPFSASTPFIAPHKFYGYSLFDKLKQLADAKSMVLRMLEDNLEMLNNPRKKVLTGQANLGDVLNSQVGGVWRMDHPDAVQEVPTPEISQQAYALLDYYDKQRSERTGVDPNAQSIGKTMPEESMNHAVERVLAMREEVVSLIVRVFAETGVKSMFTKLRNLLMRHMPREELVQLRNKWTVVNPGNWVERTNTSVVVGLGTGDRLRKKEGLVQIFQLQQQVAQGGMMGVLVSPERFAYTISELIRVQGLGDPDDFVLDPSLLDPSNIESLSPRGREAQRAKQMQEQQMQQAQEAERAAQEAQQAQQQALLNLQREVAQIQAQSRLLAEQIRAQSKQQESESAQVVDLAKFQEEQRLKWAELASKENIEEAKVATNAATVLTQQGVNLEQLAEAKRDKSGES